jgi:site-specific DNA-methyltransferase (adenine-specific)
MTTKHDYDLGTLYHGDCLEVLRDLPDESVDSVVTDPPAGIEFMGKGWDNPDQLYGSAFTKDGIGKNFLLPTAPSRNPTCRNCGREKRRRLQEPEKQCQCSNPDFATYERELRASNRDKFVAFLGEIMTEVLRVLKPGGHALVWSLPRTSHWTGTALEEAGFEVRDGISNFKDRSPDVQTFLRTLSPEQRELLERAAPTDSYMAQVFGQGFPKSLNIGKAIDKMKGIERTEVIGVKPGHEDFVDRTDDHAAGGDSEAWERPWKNDPEKVRMSHMMTAPATPEAAQHEGWGTALKPAVEIWWFVRKPLREKTVAEQVLKTGTGGINVDGSRVGYQSASDQASAVPQGTPTGKSGALAGGVQNDRERQEFKADNTKGRWPANVVLSHSPDCVKVGTKKVKNVGGATSGENAFGQESGWNAHNNRPTEIPRNRDGSEQETIDWECVPGCPVRALDEQSGNLSAAWGTGKSASKTGGLQNSAQRPIDNGLYRDTGGASRFFHNFEPEYDAPFFYTGKITSGERKQDLEEEGLINKHPTTKTLRLMSYLVKLITPPGGTVLDPFAGSGSTLVAAVNNGFKFIGIEKDPEYLKIAKGRLDKSVAREVEDQNQRGLFDEVMSLARFAALVGVL